MSNSQIETSLSKQGFIKNFILNAVGFSLITGTVQLVLYPYLSRIMSQADYGLALTLIGFANLFTAIFGIALTSTRFRVNTEYKEKKQVGDFKLLFVVGLVLNVILVAVFSLFYKKDIGYIDVLLIMIMSALAHYRVYFSIHYKLFLDFKKLLIMSLIVCLGYLVGIFLASVTGIWQFAFIIGELVGSIYVYFTCDTAKETIKTTEFIKKTSLVYFGIIIMTIFTSIPMYADRLLINPLLSSSDVAIYSVAVFFGKTVGAITTPLAGVMLSYYSLQKEMPLKAFIKSNLYILMLSCTFAFLTILSAQWVTGIFFPTIINDALPYLDIANISIIIFFASTMITPALLKFCSIKLLLIVRGLSAVLYIGLSIIMISKYQLMGFCYAMLIANSITLILTILVGIFSLKNKTA